MKTFWGLQMKLGDLRLGNFSGFENWGYFDTGTKIRK